VGEDYAVELPLEHLLDAAPRGCAVFGDGAPEAALSELAPVRPQEISWQQPGIALPRPCITANLGGISLDASTTSTAVRRPEQRCRSRG
jgi:hypothetical protein